MQPQEQHAHRVREFYQQHQQHQHHQQEQQQHPSSGGGGNGGCRQLPGGACDHAPHAHATEQPHAERQQQHAERGRGRGRGRGRAVPPEVAALTALYADAFSTVPYDAGDGAGEPCSSRPILLFDLNGTLTSHTSQRQAAGMTRIRPGAEALARLASKFRCACVRACVHSVHCTPTWRLCGQKQRAGRGARAAHARQAPRALLLRTPHASRRRPCVHAPRQAGHLYL